MSRDFTDDIDDCCEAILGHTNWGFLSTQDLNKERYIRHMTLEGEEVAHIVVFYKKGEPDYD